jgi:hypothetical protein
MSRNRAARRAEVRNHRVDAVIDAYVTWREKSAAVDATYENWGRAPREERATAYHSYLAALDREERAAASYRRSIDEAAAS